MLRIIGVVALLLATCVSANAQFAGITPCAAKSLSVSSGTSNVQLSSCGPVVILYNTTSQEAFYNIGSASNTAATTAGFYIPGGGFVTLQQPSNTAWYIAGITATSTTTFKMVQGTAKP